MRERLAAERTDPYAADQAWVRGFFRAGIEAGEGDPSVVADQDVHRRGRILRRRHTNLADDAAALVAMASQTETAEAFQAFLTALVESQAGPRPPVG